VGWARAVLSLRVNRGRDSGALRIRLVGARPERKPNAPGRLAPRPVVGPRRGLVGCGRGRRSMGRRPGRRRLGGRGSGGRLEGEKQVPTPEGPIRHGALPSGSGRPLKASPPGRGTTGAPGSAKTTPARQGNQQRPARRAVAVLKPLRELFGLRPLASSIIFHGFPDAGTVSLGSRNHAGGLGGNRVGENRRLTPGRTARLISTALQRMPEPTEELTVGSEVVGRLGPNRGDGNGGGFSARRLGRLRLGTNSIVGCVLDG
jgi:hypothetical protein